MDPVSLELGTRNLWSWLVRLLSRNSEWLSAKMRFFLPTVDLGSSDEASDPEQRVIQQLSTLHAQGLATWQSLIHCVCMELEVPLAVEVPLLSTWGQEDGKDQCGSTRDPPSHTDRAAQGQEENHTVQALLKTNSPIPQNHLGLGEPCCHLAPVQLLTEPKGKRGKAK
jgi:hypothetical protein